MQQPPGERVGLISVGTIGGGASAATLNVIGAGTMRSRPIIIIINGTRTTTLLAALLLLFFRSAWGDGSGVTKEIAPITNAPQHAYVANQDSPNGTISQYTIGPTGALSPMTPETVTAGKGDSSVAVHPSGHYAYVADFSDATVSQYTIGATGALSPMTPAKVVAGGNPLSVTVDPSGRYAYVVSQSGGLNAGGAVLQYTVGATGALSPMTPATVAAGTASVAVHPSGRYAYVANRGFTTVSQYTIGATGALSPMTPATVTPEPLAQVKAALLAGSFSKAIDAAARWHAHAPEDADAAQLLAALDEAAGKYRDAAELRKKFPPQASPQPAAPV